MNTPFEKDNPPTTPNGRSLASSACSLLKHDGWREYSGESRSSARCFYKRFPTQTRCHCNNDKEGIQVCVSISFHSQWWSYEINLSGELPDGTWINLHNWSMPEKLEDGLLTIPRLLKTWEFISANTPVYEKA